MQGNIVVKFDDIEGESQVEGFTNWMDLHFAGYNFNLPVSMGGGGLTGGTPEVTPLQISAEAGSHFPNLLTKQAGGNQWSNVIIQFLKQEGGKPEIYRTITLTGALISRYSPNGSSQGDGIDHIEVSYTTIKDEYKQQKPNNQGFESKGMFHYDQKTKKVLS